ncbi:MAG: hypothetical protein B6I35_04105 [Anaerolineaceae bacterium 4572_32.2]|nr:MAG: hypothetical protein B6I35_04105 [Anaerolineaceae bacterium 4572_32.2]HEY72675.1 hypothetical protein [Thermoflexia bacterium]
MTRKRRKPKVPLQSMTRPLLEKAFARYERGELDDDGLTEEVSALMDKIGRKPVLDALIKKLETTSDEERATLMLVISRLGDKKTIKHLWRLVRRSKMPIGVKHTALVILKQMGENVDLNDPGAYFSRQDVTLENLAEIERMSRHSLRAVIKDLHKAKNFGEIEGMMEMFDNMPGTRADKEAVQLMTIDNLSSIEEPGAADMLLAIVSATAQSKTRRAARDALLKLSGRGIFPQFRLVKRFSQEQFHAAYCTDPYHPWQQQVTMIWEWPGDTTQAMVFLLDFGFPWRGSMKDMFLTQYLSKRKIEREFIEVGNDQRQVTFARARQFILDAIAANKQHDQPLPPEYDDFRQIIERRIVNPSNEALARAADVDAETEDEWGVSPGNVVRGISMVGGKRVISLGEETLRAFEQDPDAFDDYLKSI